jgi:hypothetical protein
MEYSWIKWDIIDPKYQNTIIINRSIRRQIKEFPWREIVSQNQCIFISFNQEDYDAFEFKEFVEFIKVNSFDEMVTVINSCKYYIGNQSMPLALAYGLHKPCLAEIYPEAAAYYCGLEKFHPSYSWISPSDSFLNLESFNIKID